MTDGQFIERATLDLWAETQQEQRDTITALRAQLAEAQQERDDAMALFHTSEKTWKARVDRAEAEGRSLKAAIFGSENYAHDLKCGNFVEMAKTLHAAQKGGLDRAERAEAALAAQPLRSGWADVMSSAIQRFEVAAAVNGSATWNSIGSKAMAELLKELSRHVDRAEAALAAQIKADAGIVDQMFYNPTTDADFSDDTNLNDWAGWATIGQLREWSSEAIRAQPHDCTALDRMLAEAREKALREAADMFDADSNIAQTIRALIEKEGA